MRKLRSTSTASRVILGLALALPMIAAGCGESESSGEGGYFDGKTITVTIPFSPGGGTDTAVRFIMDRTVEELDGDVEVEYKNDESGGGIGGPNNWVIQDPKDGTSLLASTTTTVLPWLLGQEGVEYDFQQMTPLWGHPAGRMAYAHPDTGLESAADIPDSETQIITGARTGAGSELPTLLALEALEIADDMQVVTGYEGGSEQVIAYEQGEINFNHQPTGTYSRENSNWEEEGKATVLFTHGKLAEDGTWQPDPTMPDYPTVYDVYQEMHGTEPSGDAWEAFSSVVDMVGTTNYGLWVSNEAPEGARQELADAFAAAIADPTYEDEAANILGPAASLAGDDIEAFQEKLGSYDLENDPWIVFTKNLLSEKYGYQNGA